MSPAFTLGQPVYCDGELHRVVAVYIEPSQIGYRIALPQDIASQIVAEEDLETVESYWERIGRDALKSVLQASITH